MHFLLLLKRHLGGIRYENRNLSRGELGENLEVQGQQLLRHLLAAVDRALNGVSFGPVDHIGLGESQRAQPAPCNKRDGARTDSCDHGPEANGIHGPQERPERSIGRREHLASIDANIHHGKRGITPNESSRCEQESRDDVTPLSSK